jgi:hypothetical protein
MAKRLRCPFCPDSFSSLGNYEIHFNNLHRLDRVSGKMNAYKPPTPHEPERRVRRTHQKEDLDGLFAWGRQEDFDQNIPDANPNHDKPYDGPPIYPVDKSPF